PTRGWSNAMTEFYANPGRLKTVAREITKNISTIGNVRIDLTTWNAHMTVGDNTFTSLPPWTNLVDPLDVDTVSALNGPVFPTLTPGSQETLRDLETTVANAMLSLGTDGTMLEQVANNVSAADTMGSPTSGQQRLKLSTRELNTTHTAFMQMMVAGGYLPAGTTLASTYFTTPNLAHLYESESIKANKVGPQLTFDQKMRAYWPESPMAIRDSTAHRTPVVVPKLEQEFRPETYFPIAPDPGSEQSRKWYAKYWQGMIDQGLATEQQQAASFHAIYHGGAASLPQPPAGLSSDALAKWYGKAWQGLIDQGIATDADRSNFFHHFWSANCKPADTANVIATAPTPQPAAQAAIPSTDGSAGTVTVWVNGREYPHMPGGGGGALEIPITSATTADDIIRVLGDAGVSDPEAHRAEIENSLRSAQGS
ncbi:MAG: hypothetical protein ACOYN3_09110, partial [Acidimicrobiia bacterium]